MSKFSGDWDNDWQKILNDADGGSSSMDRIRKKAEALRSASFDEPSQPSRRNTQRSFTSASLRDLREQEEQRRDFDRRRSETFDFFEKSFEEEKSDFFEKSRKKPKKYGIMKVMVDGMKWVFTNIIIGKPKDENEEPTTSVSGDGGDGGNNDKSSKNNLTPTKGTKMKNMSWKLKSILALIVLTVVLSPMLFGINDAGYRTVVQYPTGTINIKFTPGVYAKWFGKTDTYSDVITFDFDKNVNPEGTTLEQKGVGVRYQDGGIGSIFGIIRYGMPNDIDSMTSLHKDFKSNNGVANKLLKAVSEESMNLTAGLLSSEEAYAEKRGTFAEWSRAQIKKGPFMTKITSTVVKDEVTGKTVTKVVPEIDYDEKGMTKHQPSDLKKYGITVSGFQIVDWGFESKTLEQIAAKRAATMAIITAKATAEKAKQDAITAEEQGKADVMKAKYEKEVEKQRAVVVAEQLKEVAVIKATQLVDVASQQKLEAEQKKLTAKEYKQEQILRGEGDAAYKRLVLEADGALEQKIAAYITVNDRFAQAIEKQKWVPEIMMGGSGSNGASGGNTAMTMIEMMGVKAAKDLALDMKINQ